MAFNLSPLPTLLLIFIKLLKFCLLQLLVPAIFYLAIYSIILVVFLPALPLDSLYCVTCTVFQAMSPPLGGTLVLPSPRPARQKL